MKLKMLMELKGNELLSFIKENKQLLISEKKALPVKFAEPVAYSPEFFGVKEGIATKAAISDIPATATSIRVKVVANACWFMDSQFDVLVDDSAKTTIKQRKPLIKHIRDHEYKLAAEVGDVADIYLQDVALTDLGLKEKGKTQCVIFETDIRKDYDKIIFDKYRTGKINQHSIGLQYIKIELALKDEEDEKEMDFWNKYYAKIINKELADQYGFFFVVQEYKLLENSCVLFGSNELTPVLEVSQSKAEPDSTTEAPVITMQQQPQFNLDEAISKFKFNF